MGSNEDRPHDGKRSALLTYRNAKGVLKKEYLHSFLRDLRYNF